MNQFYCGGGSFYFRLSASKERQGARSVTRARDITTKGIHHHPTPLYFSIHWQDKTKLEPDPDVLVLRTLCLLSRGKLVALPNFQGSVPKPQRRSAGPHDGTAPGPQSRVLLHFI
jgi:hypothetical protein